MKKTKDELFREKQESMPTEELIELAENEISKLCKTGGKSLTMCVPPMVTDTDMLLCEVLRRLKETYEWISVSERLPEHLQKVIFYSEKHGMHCGIFNGAGGLNEFLSRGEEIPNVIEWKPQPTPPTK